MTSTEEQSPLGEKPSAYPTMATKIPSIYKAPSLPYYRDARDLPSPLPTMDEIDNADIDFQTKELNPEMQRCVVVRDYVVKGGRFVEENEGHVLLFIEEYLNIPAPRLYAMFRARNWLYLVMQKLPGDTLEFCWPSLSEDAKVSICSQLRTIHLAMRSLPSPGFYGSITKGPLKHRFFFSRQDDQSITGPFETEKELNMAMALRSKYLWGTTGNESIMPEFFSQTLPRALVGHPSIFTHADFHPRNVIIEETIGKKDGGSSYNVTGLIDWEAAGWYPNYWEYAGSFADFRWENDWDLKYASVVDPWDLEAAMLRTVRLDLDPW